MLWMIWLLPIVVTPVCAGALVWWRLHRTPRATAAGMFIATPVATREPVEG